MCSFSPKINTTEAPIYGNCVSLHPMLKTAEERTNAVGYVIERLSEEQIPGIWNELVTSSFGAPIFFSFECAAAPYFGIKDTPNLLSKFSVATANVC
ncbi:hypothetical protein RJT34_27030 [Clitoria ternatea]|uniref:DUF4743 domain-containing protein n=1 Tax=Clitoria ternatea TaxID=43366 RepID=A0AAN9FCH2_CLITE